MMDQTQQALVIAAIVGFLVSVIPAFALFLKAWFKANTAQITAEQKPSHTDVQTAITTAVNAVLLGQASNTEGATKTNDSGESAVKTGP